MIETILTTVLSSALLLKNPSISTQPQKPQIVFTQVLPQKNYVGYTVQKNDTLESIAQAYYGSTDYWTTLWNDNLSIVDPGSLPEGDMLKIRVEKPSEPEKLFAHLEAQNDKLTDEKNAAYLAKIGYGGTPVPVVTQPTVTQAPVVQSAQVPSTISDEALTYLGNCEAGMNPTRNSGNGYFGAFQFSYGTWKSLNTGYERADLAPLEVQKAAVQQLLSRSSIYHQFPACARKMQSAGLI